ncbi:MAG: hypothetical protein LBN26_09280 [Christensenellaceae bacterium]|nr:hypothetical protein [Christensenellaceae bacterium]
MNGIKNMKTIKRLKSLLVLMLAVICLALGCTKNSHNLKLEDTDDGGRLYIDGIEYVREFSTTLWTKEYVATEEEYIGKVSVRWAPWNDLYKYEVYAYKNQPFVYLMPKQPFISGLVRAILHFQRKDIIFPELSVEAIDKIRLINAADYEPLNTKYNTNKETLQKLLEIIHGNERAHDIGWEKLYLTLVSDASPEYCSWHSISENNGQYYIQVAPGNNYAPIPRELLEEIIGGPLPE